MDQAGESTKGLNRNRFEFENKGTAPVVVRMPRLNGKESQKEAKMTITAALVKELRDKSGAGMMDCKNALTENDGDIEAAMDWLRSKGIAKAEKSQAV